MTKFYTIREVAECFRVDRRTVYRWIDKGILKAIRINQDWRISEDEIKRLSAGGGY